ncbi:MAG: hypothetical protein GY782_12360 [Gammaproteobacteria bacterium]|nr:hypothetical protein [Gammaproteobacteria bacterium]
MTKHYSPKGFLRKASNQLLQEYFQQKGVLSDFDFTTLKGEKKLEALYQAWRDFPDKSRADIDKDFQEINNLSTDGGRQAIIDEAQYHDESLAKQFDRMSVEESALWTLINRPDYWAGATAFYHADQQAPSYWQKRKNLPDITAKTDATTLGKFEAAISHYFHSTQGRGKNCELDCYRRYNKDYFFAYPEDYVQASIDWQDNKLNRQPRSPAFEIIFIYYRIDHTLDIYLPGHNKKEIIPALQERFARIILDSSLPKDNQEDNRIYQLEKLKYSTFRFDYNLEQCITNVAINRIRLLVSLNNKKHKITCEANPKEDNKTIYDALETVGQVIPLQDVQVTQAGIKVTLQDARRHDKTFTKSFNITAPNKCNLKQDFPQHVAILDMLKASGLEPVLVANDEDEDDNAG